MLTRLIKFARENNFLFLIIILAVSLRIFSLTQNPPSLNWDEVSHGYNAYSILKTGRDEWGNFLPVIFRAYGDYKLPVYIYLTTISEFFIGVSPLAVRLPSALAGVVTVIFTYLLVKELFDRRVALLSGLLVAVEPWSLFLSRGAFEANVALAFIVIGTYFLLRSFRTGYDLLLSTFFLGLSVWTYNSARVFVPLFLLALLIIYRERLKDIYKVNFRIIHTSLFIILLFFLPMFWQLLSPVGRARYSWVTIVDEGAIAQINEARNSSSLSPSLRRVVYNKGTFFISKFARNWASHFSGDFLFFKGGSNFQFSVPNHGVLYVVNLVFLLLGVVLLLRKRTKGSFLILVWFFLGSIPGSLTREAPHALRAITMLPIPMIVCAYGVIFVWDKLTRNLKFLFLAAYLVFLAGGTESYLGIYFGSYSRDYSWSWQYGYKEVASYVKQNYDKYEKVIVTKKYGEPHEFFLFFWPWSPDKFRNDPNLIRFYQSNWYWVDRFDKFYFVNDWQISTGGEKFVLERKYEVDCSKSRCLLITSPGNYPDGWKKLETINFLDGNPAFEILEN